MGFILGQCQCGCKQSLGDLQSRHRDILKKYINGHTPKNHAAGHQSWKGGRTIDEEGYVLLRAEGHPRANPHGFYVPEHILVMEKHLGRPITTDEIVHHKNGIKTDNRPENLQVMTRTEHMLHHWRERKAAPHRGR